MGAEILVKLTLDPVELLKLNKYVHIVRALENQAFFISTQSAGIFLGSHLSGNSMVVDPEGEILWEAGNTAVSACVVLDLEQVRLSRNYGTIFRDHYMQHLKNFNFPMPFAKDVTHAPIFKDLMKAPETHVGNDETLKAIGIGTIGKRFLLKEKIDLVQLQRKMEEFLKSRLTQAHSEIT